MNCRVSPNKVHPPGRVHRMEQEGVPAIDSEISKFLTILLLSIDPFPLQQWHQLSCEPFDTKKMELQKSDGKAARADSEWERQRDWEVVPKLFERHEHETFPLNE